MLNILKNSYYRRVLILAVLLRLLIMPFYFHPDIKTYNFQASFLKEGVFNIYSYLDEHKKSLPLKDDFVYFPLTYFLLGGYQFIAQPLFGSNFPGWLANASQTAIEEIGVYRYLFLMKFPYLLLDLCIAFLLLKFFNNENEKKKVFTLWLLNPFSIILIYIFSNVDIFPVLAVILSLLFAKDGKLLLAAISLGLGAGFKGYPLLFVPFLLLSGKDIKQKLTILLASVGTFGLIILPFLQTHGFQNAALASGLTTRIIFPGLSIGFGETIMMSAVMLSALFFFGLIKDLIIRTEDLWKYYLAATLMVLSVIHFHIQWLLWPMPLLIFLAVKNNKYFAAIFVLMTLAFLIPILYEDKYMSVSLFSAISREYNFLPSPRSVVQKIYDPLVLQSIFHSAFLGGSLIFIWQIFKKEDI